MKLKTQTLLGIFETLETSSLKNPLAPFTKGGTLLSRLQSIFTSYFFIISFHFQTVYSTSSFSISSIFSYHQICSIYSKALSSETAQVMFGVPGSNLSGKELFSLYSSFFTQAIAQPHEKTGFIISSNSFLAHQTPSQLSAIILCAVKNIISQLSFFTSTLKCGKL